ncbi:unnamed protein product [Thelazia callipaeda]|uniref:Deoxyribodipyrimidine photo-lyase n=1 Tax=Thelazia callipaeda TaxID=103827 RepID=A0A0N5CVX4_THECL|nr:unnamed protein product [Thelazia callipaeda]
MVSSRIQPLNKQNIAVGKYVLLLARCIRSEQSPSFSYASQKGNEHGVPVIVTYIYESHRHNVAQRKFLLEGLKCLESNLAHLHTPLLVIKTANDKEAMEIILRLCDAACEVVTDAAYLREDRCFQEKLSDELVTKCRKITKVEGNVAVPVTALLNGPAYNAQSIRKVVWHFVDDLLLEKWDDIPKIHCKSLESVLNWDLECLNISKELDKAANECKTNTKLEGGEIAARRVLNNFIVKKLSAYEKERNIPNSNKQSLLSPYLHFGMISPIAIIAEVMKSSAPKSAKDAFLEELVVRRELSHNFVYYYRDTYDTFDCLPDWAKKTMDEHQRDKREYIYNYKELEEGRTHDVFWNAAQFELVFAHKMSGYLRMYWAKKVIEWSADYKTAYSFLIEQNDKYELDGRDPNGFCGVMWNFGMHDRAHAERPVFGKLRYMCADGLRRKFKKYIDEYVRVNYKLAGRKLEIGESQPKKRNSLKDFDFKVKKVRKS